MSDPKQRAVMCLKTISAFILRLVLRVPLILMAHVMWALGSLFEHLGDGLNDAQGKLKQITSAPFVIGWRREIAEMQEAERLRMLKSLRNELDT